MSIKIQIITDDPSAFMEDLGASTGQKAAIPGNATITVTTALQLHAVEGATAVQLLLEFGTSVGAQLVASWIYDKIKNHANSVAIGSHQNIEMNRASVAQTVEAEIKESNKSA